jgi:8-oxo-dGTP pyrophosphatase MutT (NUDIX family)
MGSQIANLYDSSHIGPMPITTILLNRMLPWRGIRIPRNYTFCHDSAVFKRIFCSNSSSNDDSAKHRLHQRVWKARHVEKPENNVAVDKGNEFYWTDRVVDVSLNGNMNFIEDFVQKISDQSDLLGGKMREQQLGVLHQDPVTDMQMLMENYTVKAVASALRDREDALQQAAVLASENRISELVTFLQVFHPKYVLERRQQQKQSKRHISRFNPDDLNEGIAGSQGTGTTDPISALHLDASRQLLRKTLMRMPRTITSAHSKRAGVCLALCLSHGVPSILLEKRATHLRSHPDEVCLPGGMVCDIQDQTIVSTSIREMKEEIGGLDSDATSIEVIGILRLNWGEVHHLTGVAVTPVVCYLGELPELSPNPDEVSEVFTIPLVDLLNKSFWIHKEQLAPIFVGGPYVIWGLTGYILERLAIELGRLRPS